MEQDFTLPRPQYCPSDLIEGVTCHACGAPPDGVCRALKNGQNPAEWMLPRVVLVDRDTGEEI